MRFRAFIAVFAAASTAAGASIGAVQQRRETTTLGFVGFENEVPPVLESRPGSRSPTLSNLRFGVRIERSGPLVTLSKREDDDDEDDEDDGDDGDDGDDDDDDKRHHRTNGGAIAGGVIGGILFLLLLLFLLFWFKFRPRRQKRRQQKKKEQDEKEKEAEEERKRRAEEAAVAAQVQPTHHRIQRPYQPIPSHDEEEHQQPPPNYQQMFPSTSASRRAVAEPSTSAAPLSPQSVSQQHRRGTMEFPAELPSPVDGREPSSLPTALEPSDAKVDRIPSPPPATTYPTYY